jgi:hypothetical protein
VLEQHVTDQPTAEPGQYGEGGEADRVELFSAGDDTAKQRVREDT